MIAVAGGIILALLTICMLISFALVIRSIFRTIGQRGMAYNISSVRGVPPGYGKRWVGVLMMFVVVIGLGYIVNKTTQPNVPYSHDGEINGRTPN
jgi:hypothetical protein